MRELQLNRKSSQNFFQRWAGLRPVSRPAVVQIGETGRNVLAISSLIIGFCSADTKIIVPQNYRYFATKCVCSTYRIEVPAGWPWSELKEPLKPNQKKAKLWMESKFTYFTYRAWKTAVIISEIKYRDYII